MCSSITRCWMLRVVVVRKTAQAKACGSGERALPIVEPVENNLLVKPFLIRLARSKCRFVTLEQGALLCSR